MATPAAERLDHYLVRLGFAPSRRAARAIVERGNVRINGRRCTKSAIVAPSDIVEVAEAPPPAAIVPNPALEIEVLYADAALVVVNKPGGLACHPIRAGESDTVMNAVAARFPETAALGDKPFEGGLVHRLDNGTSGALIVARTAAAFTALRAAIRSGAIVRRYQALVAGRLERALELERRIAHHPKNPRKMTIGDPESLDRRRIGRAASTRAEPLRRVGATMTIVAVTPRTGSRHQIRVHLADAGFPIVGDHLYGGPETAALAPGRFWLHLGSLALDSPASGHIKVTAPLPADLTSLINAA
ncbi:MAG TPA: RluA family pseudouridine synthase [Candidatus Binataceae bacterium]|nr:RluA family pseudouridine synthase [Candidatus Binataceae bacterium]